MKFTPIIAAGAFALALPMAAGAATVSADIEAGESYSFSNTLEPGGDTEFQVNVNVLEDLVIRAFSFSGTGTNEGDDLRSIMFGFTPNFSNRFTDIRVMEDAAAATEFLVGRMFDAGEMFMIRFHRRRGGADLDDRLLRDPGYAGAGPDPGAGGGRAAGAGARRARWPGRDAPPQGRLSGAL